MKVKNQKNVSRIVKVSGMALLLFSAVGQPGMTAYAAGPGETVQAQVEQSPRWEGQGDAWRVKTEDGKGYMTNAWFQDLDGSWYMLGADGYMYSGIVTDPGTGASYLLNTEHDGHFGRMVTANGAYIINGQQVYLTFNNTNPADGTYGAITGGLTELRAAGVKEVTKGAEGTAPQTAEQTSVTTEANTGHWYDKYMKADGTLDFSRMTREEQEAYVTEQIGGEVGHLGGLDLNAAQEAADRLNRK